jgi:two-component sensor histidine kinase
MSRAKSVMEQNTEALLNRASLSEGDKRRLMRVAEGMAFVADISRADLLLYVRDQESAIVAAQARPHSIMPVYAENLLGYRIDPAQQVATFRAMRWGYRLRGTRRLIAGGAPVIQEVHPLRGDDGGVVGALSVEANLIAYVRQKSRSKVFQRTVRVLQGMLLRDELKGADMLSPFGQNDGILVVDHDLVTRYASGIATEHYRRLGYLDSIVDRHLSTLDTGDQRMFQQVLNDLRCHEAEYTERVHLSGGAERTWLRKGAPLIGRSLYRPWWPPTQWLRRKPIGVLFTIHDATEERKKERERKIQSAMIQEIHHRVKNNLQTVAAVLRIQLRRSDNEEVRAILRDSVNRVLSMAVVHEYLSREQGQAINVREVTQRIVQQTKQGGLPLGKEIRIVLGEGNNLYLPARQATACALVINELLQNALEHAFGSHRVGTITVDLLDQGDAIQMVIADDGEGLPADFSLEDASSLGLEIVRTLVQDDLRGTFEIKSNGGVQAIVRFSKKVMEGEGLWNGLE